MIYETDLDHEGLDAIRAHEDCTDEDDVERDLNVIGRRRREGLL